MMKKVLPTIAIGLFTILLFDVAGSIASREIGFNYSYLFLPSAILYVTVAFFIAKQSDKKITILATGFLGLIDATIGFEISTSLRANTGENQIQMAAFVWVAIIIFMILLACLYGLVGWWLANKYVRK